MMTSTDAVPQRLVLLAPSFSAVPEGFTRTGISRYFHEALLSEAQTFRGRVYLQENAIKPSQLTPDGRHRLEIDDRSWHLLVLDEQAHICGCVRYVQHENSAPFERLSVHNSALALSDLWGTRLRASVEAELSAARRNDIGYIEVGGWAISEERRCKGDALRIALATYALAQLLGDGIGITTATVRHCSSSILRRIGGQPLKWNCEELPPYYDPQYDCVMEILRFDSRAPGMKYRNRIEEIRSSLTGALVVCREALATNAAGRDHDEVEAPFGAPGSALALAAWTGSR